MTLKTSRRGEIPPFIVMEVMRAAAERAATQEAVYHLEVGQPGTPAPQGVIEAAQAALAEQRLGYTVALGLPELRTAIARHYAEDYGVSVPMERIALTTGSSGGFLLSFLACFEPGDRVALVAPGYPCYRHILSVLGIEPVIIETGLRDRYQPSPALLDAARARTGALDGLIVASPSNPTGTMLPKAEMAALAAYCDAEGIRFISDEIYQGVTYGRGFETALSHSDTAVVVNSFSKYFSMTGWRLGWLVLPEDLMKPVERLAQNLFISPPTLSQAAAIAAFDCKEELEANVARYAANRDLLLRELPKAGFSELAPSDGAFYLYADIAAMTNDSQGFCARMLAETGVAATPGLDFDEDRGNATMRFSFAGDPSEIAAAAEALKVWRA
ncbi:MAG: aminotransferase class I/II-fold pyridoxal phosphate-dependent enzyme [Alphaproteobacteria bacterium]|nr:aminotransferase class I/II-fold pyridoxal phosphate-dependent enzyme [Alphaproteobacteria bacterium]